MAFVLDGLETEAYDRVYSDRQLFRRILAYMKPHARKVAGIVVVLALNSLATSFAPILISRSLNQFLKAVTPFAAVLFTGGILILGVCAWIFNYLLQRLETTVIGNMVLRLQEDALRSVLTHDLSFFDEHPTGKIVSRVTSDTQDFSYIITLVTDLASEAVILVFFFVWLILVNPPLTLLLVSFAPVAVLVALSFRRIARTVTRHAKRFTAKINSQIQESISGIHVAKTFRQEGALYRTFLVNNKQGYQVGLRRGIVLSTIFPLMGTISGTGIAVLIAVSGFQLQSAGLTPGDWYLFMQAVGFFFFPLMSIASFWSQFQDGLSAAERVFSLVDSEPRVKQTGSVVPDPFAGRIEFRNLSFRYKENEPVLEDFSLVVRARETIALVGHTGAGKSSIASLIARFYEYQGGALLVDGVDARDLDLEAYRNRIGLVSQDPFLFSGTVRDNIRYGRPGSSDDQIREAAFHIGRGEWVGDLADGLDTVVTQRGANISMGQRQLIALARVFLKDPRVFILDEATSSVDPFTEELIQEGLDTVMRDRTVIVIAHRLSTVRHVDRIVAIDHGKIIEEGSHDELLARGGYYAELYNTYFRHQSLEYVECCQDEEEPGAAPEIH